MRTRCTSPSVRMAELVRGLIAIVSVARLSDSHALPVSLFAATLPAHLRDCDGGMEVAALIPIYSALLHPDQTTVSHAFNVKSLYWQSFRQVLRPLLEDEDLHHGFRFEQ